jgi:hypothetical protein
MKLIKKYKFGIILVVGMAIFGQLFFALISSGFTAPRYEGRIFSTTGVRHEQEDLHTLNEAAHYFGQTIIGWLKFPHFYSDLQKDVSLPEGSSLSAHMQERQNIIFSIFSPVPLKQEQLVGVKDYIQKKLDAYNSINRTGFVMTNVDYELVEIQRTYEFGAIVTLIASTTLALAFLFLRKELMNGK